MPGLCERCGLRFEVVQAGPGEGDLGLDRIKATFRYCASCHLFVGRTCCWNRDAAACIFDAPPQGTITAVVPSVMAEEPAIPDRAFAGLAELTASLDALERIAEATRSVSEPADDPQAGGTAWSEAWWAIGFAITRAETSRDAAAKALWRSGVPDSSTEGRQDRLAELDARYADSRALIEARLHAAGGSPGPGQEIRHAIQRRIRATLRRTELANLGDGALAAVTVLALGTALALQLGYLNPWALSNSAASVREGAVIGGGGSPAPTNSPVSSPASDLPRAVIARVDFDELRIGELAGASDEIGWVAGHAEVVAFPSPFDRSIRLVGDAPHRFCVPSGLHDGGVALDVDLYAETPLRSGRLKLSTAPSGASATAASVPLKVLDDLRPEAWHRLHVSWMPQQAVTVVIGGTAGQMETLNLPSAPDRRAVAGAVCISVSSMAKGAVLLLDNLQVEQ